MKIKTFYLIIAAVAITFSTSTASNAQNDGPRSRGVTLDALANQRPERPREKGVRPKPVRPKPNPKPRYNPVRTEKNVFKHANLVAKGPVLPLKVTNIGVTFWKLRPPRSQEIGKELPCEDKLGTMRTCIAERVGPDTTFKIGDQVRFAIESSETGYLYVLDRETYADGKVGQPKLIFPYTAEDEENNEIGPGMLFDIPDQRDDEPYFNIKLDKAGSAAHTGEYISIIISPKPLNIFRPDKDRFVKVTNELVAIETAATVDIFTRTDEDDKLFSAVEAEASCGPTARSLVRKSVDNKSDKPCGKMSRQLYRDEAKPQSLYRSTVPTGQPAVAFVRLPVQP